MIYHHRHQDDDDLMATTTAVSLSEEEGCHGLVVLDFGEDGVCARVDVSTAIGNGQRMMFLVVW